MAEPSKYDNSGLNQLFSYDGETKSGSLKTRILALVLIAVLVVTPTTVIFFPFAYDAYCYCFCGNNFEQHLNYLISLFSEI